MSAINEFQRETFIQGERNDMSYVFYEEKKNHLYKAFVVFVQVEFLGGSKWVF